MIVNNKSQKPLNYMTVNGQSIPFKKDDDDDDFYMVGVNGRPDQKISQEDFLNLYMQNQNMVSYNGEDYMLKKGMDDEEE